jgi:hypothetical protein
MGPKMADKANRDGVAERCPAPAGHQRLDVDLALLGHDAQLRRDVELSILTTAKQPDANTLDLRRTVPGISAMLRLVRLEEIPASRRVPRVQAFVSYGRLVTWAQEAAGKRDGTSGRKIGNAYRTWAVSEAAGLF